MGLRRFPGARCVICIHERLVRAHCPMCNGEGWPCWGCGHGTYWAESVTTEDVSLGVMVAS